MIGQQLAENYADIVSAAAGAFHGINNMTVLNGADGVTQALSTLIGNAGAGISTVRQLLAAQGQTNGHNGADPDAEQAPSSGDRKFQDLRDRTRRRTMTRKAPI